jgi:hypothetical protein
LQKLGDGCLCECDASAGTNSGIGCIGVGSDAGKTEKRGSEICVRLGKKDLAAGGAIAIQANRIWLVSGATVIFNFLKIPMPRTEPATAASKAVKSLP